LAAPLIVHPLVAGLVLENTGAKTGVALAVLAIFALLGAIAVVIDRRAILVSGLAYAGFAFVTLIHHAGMMNQSIPITVLILGAFVLLLSAGWRPLRAFLLRLLPANLARRLPHPILTP
jgi:hypothetical protein